MAYDIEKSRETKRRYYERNREKCRAASRSWKRERKGALDALKKNTLSWDERKKAILAKRDKNTHRYRN